MILNSKSKPIGIFDSGVGGLTVVREIMTTLPHQPLVYFGDCFRAPYGDRNDEELMEFSRRIVRFLLSKDVGAVVVACGTISARIFEQVRAFVPPNIPVYGMLAAGVQAVVETSKNGKIGVIATEGTVNSGTFEHSIVAARPDATVKSVACPLFVPLVEEGWVDNEVADLTAQIYMRELEDSGIDALLLGCTHYPLLSPSIAKALPQGVTLVNPAGYVAQALQRDGFGAEDGDGSYDFYVSGKKERFDKIAKIILPVFDKGSILV
ncbi:MAG: glutamate racemase [Defluviitaleaceae bacterium]|nr:glutamate racemase [Defluviitaleaceae bacterium]